MWGRNEQVEEECEGGTKQGKQLVVIRVRTGAAMNAQQRVLLAIAVAALSVLSGCWTYSLHPLYSDGDSALIYEPALEGTWKSGHDDLLLIITGDSKSQEYTLRLVDGGKSGNGSDADHRSELVYTGRLVQLAAERFLDAVPGGEGIPGAIAAHNVFKVAVERGAISLSLLDVNGLCGAPEAQQVVLGQCIDGDFILTASTDVLQDFVRKHSDDEEVFPTMDEEDRFHRVAKPGSSE